MKTQINFRLSGVLQAAKEAGTSRQHIWACCTGRRNPSDRVANAIKRYVVAYAPIRPDVDQPNDAHMS